jgi:hypothetical protein
MKPVNTYKEFSSYLGGNYPLMDVSTFSSLLTSIDLRYFHV